LPVLMRHADELLTLPLLHRDPFDRLLVAQAIAEDLVLVTRDPAVAAYPVGTLVA
jgi:PIN domain nuclease of toxin-antitoxin system